MTWPETRASGTTSSLFSPRHSLSCPSYCRSWSWSSFSAPISPLSPPWTAVPPRSVRARSSFWTNSSRTSIGSAVSISHQQGARTRDLGKFPTASPSSCPLLLPSQLRPSASPKRRCSKDEDTHEESFQGFPALPSDVPWDSESVWSTFAFYLLSLHIPLSFGGLSVVAHVLHRPVLDPQTEALSLFGIQVFEFFGTLCLLKSTAKPQFKLISLFKGNGLSNGTKTWVASALGFCSLIFLVFLTSFLADRVIGPKAVNNLILKEILLSSDISRAACVLVYCIITPLLEEIVYRGFLLTSISSTSKWQQAVLLSSAIFSAVHFSGENSLQLFLIGCVLGCSYCWSGDLSTSFLIHSLYNALILVIIYAS